MRVLRLRFDFFKYASAQLLLLSFSFWKKKKKEKRKSAILIDAPLAAAILEKNWQNQHLGQSRKYKYI